MYCELLENGSCKERWQQEEVVEVGSRLRRENWNGGWRQEGDKVVGSRVVYG